MGLFASVIYRKRCEMLDQYRAYERMAQERIQRARDENLPPFYNDHVRDRACIFEGELPPEIYPRALEVVVVRPRRPDSFENLTPITPEEIVRATETTMARIGSGDVDSYSHLRNPSSTMSIIDLIVSEVPPRLGTPVEEAGVIRPTPRPPRRPIRAMASNRNTPSALAAAILLRPTPNSTTADLSNNMNNGQNIHALPPPPSYDATHAHTTLERDEIARPVSVPPSTSDYFSHHTHNNTSDSYIHAQHYQHQSYLYRPPANISPLTTDHENSSPIETPRYSDEFPSHMPYEQHLEGYQRTRALSDRSLEHQS
ncbi:hypothetical protein FBU30_010376 [Linnemannia zychae]|nr:hypothetical protein FBU30_010376 [Linnemannia zychae]